MTDPSAPSARQGRTKSQPIARTTGDREFVLEHTFRAPASKVFAAYTDPKLVGQWWTPTDGSLSVEALDLRPGGKWRFVQGMANGRKIAYSGTYLEVRPATRLAYTFAIEGRSGSEVTASVDLKEEDGATRLTLTNLCASKEARDAMIRYGAAAGAKMAWDRLAELLSRV